MKEDVKFEFLGSSPVYQKAQIQKGRKFGTYLDKLVHVSESTNIW